MNKANNNNNIYGLPRHRFTFMCAHIFNVYLISVMQRHTEDRWTEVKDFQNKSVLP